MYAQFRYLDGRLTGQTKASGNDFITLGRHPNSDIPFDPGTELDVSIRHAAVFRQGGGFMVRDLGSTNGTFLNDARVRGDRPLEPADVIRLGPNGPRLEFSVVEAPPHFTPAPRGPTAAESWAATPLEPPPLTINPPRSTTERVRVEVQRQMRPWRWLALAVALLGATGAAWFEYRRERDRDALEAERTALLGQIDGLMAQLRSASVNLATLAKAMTESQADVGRLRDAIASGSLTQDRLSTLRHDVDASIGRQRTLLRAALLDTKAIVTGNGPALALVLAQASDSQTVSGSGFAIHALADTVWIATARHVIEDSAGRPALRLGVIFNGSAQNFRAERWKESDSLDLAVIQVVVKGAAPIIKGIGQSSGAGDPVAILGFPNGIESSANARWRTTGVGAATFAGTITEQNPTRLTLDGYGTYGSSGSPVFNGTGEVIGMVFGGDPASNGRTLYAVPARFIRQMIR